MTGYLEVTREPAQLELLPGASGRVDYVVTNKTGQKDYVRAVLPKPTRVTLSLVGEGEMMVENNATTSFTLEVVAKADAAPGDEDLNLTFVAARDSDKFSATAPATRVIVNPKTAPVVPITGSKPFPWWIVAVVGGVLAVAGIVVAFIVTGPKKAGELCEKDDECGGGLSCIAARADEDRAGDDGTHAAETASETAASSAKKCLKPLAAACAKDSECATDFCKTPASEDADSICAERIGPGGACGSDEECLAPGQCKTGKCLLSLAAECRNDAECESGWCNAADAAAANAANAAKQCRALPEFGVACATGRRCSANLTCGPTGLDVCLYSNDQPCQMAQSCASLFCSTDKCTTAPAVGAACVSNQCGHGQVCERGKCLKPSASACAQPAECASGKCTNQVCDPFGGIGDVCANNEQCSSGLQCLSGKCLSVVNGTCSAHTDCTSNRCKSGKCQLELRVGDDCNPKTAPCAYALTCDEKTSKCETRKRLPYYDLAIEYMKPHVLLEAYQPSINPKAHANDKAQLRKNP